MTAKIINYYYNTSKDEERSAYMDLIKQLQDAGYTKVLINRFLTSKQNGLEIPCLLDPVPAQVNGFVLTSTESKGGFAVEWAEETQYRTHHIKRGYYICNFYSERLK